MSMRVCWRCWSVVNWSWETLRWGILPEERMAIFILCKATSSSRILRLRVLDDHWSPTYSHRHCTSNAAHLTDGSLRSLAIARRYRQGFAHFQQLWIEPVSIKRLDRKLPTSQSVRQHRGFPKSRREASYVSWPSAGCKPVRPPIFGGN